MTLKELKDLLATERPENDNLEVKVWLPGSRITLVGKAVARQGNVLLIEGNLDEGSALS